MTGAFDASIFARVSAAIQETTFLCDVAITAKSRFDEDLDLDRLEVMEVVMHLEAIFHTEFPQEAILGFHAVSDVVGHLSSRFFPNMTELAIAGSS